MKATINKAKTSNYGSPIGRGVPPREGGGTAKERGRIDKGPPRRRQSGADGCPLSDEANCRTCPQRGQELYEKRKRQQNRRRSPHKKRPLRSSPPFERPPKRKKQRAKNFALCYCSPFRGGKPRGHEGERQGGERPAAKRRRTKDERTKTTSEAKDRATNNKKTTKKARVGTTLAVKGEAKRRQTKQTAKGWNNA